MLTNANELIGDIRIRNCLGCSDHTMVESMLQRDMRQAKSKMRMLHFRKANLQVFRELVSKTPWKTVLMDKGAEQRWQIFKEAFFRAQELSIPDVASQERKARPAWLNWDLLVKLKSKKKMHRQWKQRKVP